MNRQIWKFHMPIDATVKISIPKDAWLIAVNEQRGNLYVWAICDLENDRETRTFHIYGTGHPLPDTLDEADWLATVPMSNGLVWHVFEEQTT